MNWLRDQVQTLSTSNAALLVKVDELEKEVETLTFEARHGVTPDGGGDN